MTPPARPSTTRWHAIDLDSLLTLLNTNAHGLTSEEARLRRNRYGLNRLPRRRPASIRQILLRQFKSPLIFILAIAAAVSLLIHPDNPTDALFILAVLLLNAAIGGFQEYKAERSSQALLRLLQIRASVLRDGEVQEMDAEQVVPGDVVWLESGNRVPADLRLLTAHGLEIDESLLTGESLPVHKDQQWSGDDATPMADQRNMAYAGAIVLHGRARGVVVATGPATAVGQLAVDVLGSWYAWSGSPG
jgi:magnesium-transporting ATPase (P-type)